MSNSLQHIKVDIKCDINCDHSNCIQYALNLIHRNIITYPSTVYKSIELEFYDCSKNQKYSSVGSNYNHANTIVYSKTSPIDNCNFSSHQNLQEQKDRFTDNFDKHISQHGHSHKQISVNNSITGFKTFEQNKPSNDIITTENIFSLDESSIDGLSLESAKAHLAKAIKLLKQASAPNSADRSSTTYRTTHSLIPFDNRSPIPPAQDVLNWLTKEELGKQSRPNLQRSDTNSSLSSYHLANQSPISPMANRETSKRSASDLTPIMMTMPVKYPRRSSRDITSDSSQDNQLAPPPLPRRPPMSPSLLRRHAASTKEPKYAMSEWDQHLQIIKDQEEAYETVTESPASSPKRAAEIIERDYDSESTTSLENPIAAFEAMANH